uniref:Uncharacterized protein n=1 Tax=Arundo donax TaxID=35708 RepID=A0A0A9CKG9_ARUDO
MAKIHQPRQRCRQPHNKANPTKEKKVADLTTKMQDKHNFDELDGLAWALTGMGAAKHKECSRFGWTQRK